MLDPTVDILQSPNLEPSQDHPERPPNRQWIARLNADAFAWLIEDPYDFVGKNIRYADRPDVPVGLSRDENHRDVAIQCRYDFEKDVSSYDGWRAIVSGVAGLNLITAAPLQRGLVEQDHLPLPRIRSGTNHGHGSILEEVSTFHVELNVNPKEGIGPSDLEWFKLSVLLDPPGYIAELNDREKFHFHGVEDDAIKGPFRIEAPPNNVLLLTVVYSNLIGVNPLVTQVCNTAVCPGPGGSATNSVCCSSSTLTTWVAPPPT